MKWNNSSSREGGDYYIDFSCVYTRRQTGKAAGAIFVCMDVCMFCYFFGRVVEIGLGEREEMDDE